MPTVVKPTPIQNHVSACKEFGGSITLLFFDMTVSSIEVASRLTLLLLVALAALPGVAVGFNVEVGSIWGGV